ncbi:hypothetical protein [Actinomadura geliboluensis]|uniref:hypothetical protein n=1 Tax=Actinomadura geliboluensis TaxID=882440 RepID=UPI0036AE72C6
MWNELVIFCEKEQVESLRRALLEAGATIYDEQTHRLTRGGQIVDFVLDEEVRRSYSKEEWREVVGSSAGGVPVLVLSTSTSVAGCVLREVVPFSLSETIVDDGRAPLRLMTLEQWIRAVVEE